MGNCIQASTGIDQTGRTGGGVSSLTCTTIHEHPTEHARPFDGAMHSQSCSPSLDSPLVGAATAASAAAPSKSAKNQPPRLCNILSPPAMANHAATHAHAVSTTSRRTVDDNTGVWVASPPGTHLPSRLVVTAPICFPIRHPGEYISPDVLEDVQEAEVEWLSVLQKSTVSLRLTKSADSVGTLMPFPAGRSRRSSRATVSHFPMVYTQSLGSCIFVDEDDTDEVLSVCDEAVEMYPTTNTARLTYRSFQAEEVSAAGIQLSPLWDFNQTSPLVWNARKAQFDKKFMQQRKVCIAVVDDSATTCKMVARQLEKAVDAYPWLRQQLDGRPVCTLFADGDEINNFANASSFHLIVTDFDMPHVNGADVVRHSKMRHPNIPVCVMSGYVNEERRALCESVGAAAFIAKPLTQQHAAVLVAMALQTALMSV